MVKLNPKYIKDNTDQTLVVLQQKEYDELIEQLEDLEDVGFIRKQRKTTQASTSQ